MNVLWAEGSRKIAHQLDDLLERWQLRRSGENFTNNRNDGLREYVNIDRENAVRYEKKYFSSEIAINRLSSLAYDEITKLRFEVGQRRLEIEFQLKKFKTLSRNEKKRSDYAWVAEIKAIQRAYIDLDFFIANQIKKLRPKQFSNYFVSEAAQMLPKSIFDEIREAAYKQMLTETEAFNA